MKMENKRGLQLAISTIILLILGIAVLIGLIMILMMGWKDFKVSVEAVLGSDVAQAKKQCELQCSLENNYDFCCGQKQVKGEVYTCQDELLKTDCVLDCFGVVC